MARRRAREVEDERDVRDATVPHVVEVRRGLQGAWCQPHDRQLRDVRVGAPHLANPREDRAEHDVVRPDDDPCALAMRVVGTVAVTRRPRGGGESVHQLQHSGELVGREEGIDQARSGGRVGQREAGDGQQPGPADRRGAPWPGLDRAAAGPARGQRQPLARQGDELRHDSHGQKQGQFISPIKTGVVSEYNDH